MAQIKKPRKDLPYLLLEFNKKYGNPWQPIIGVVEGDDEAYYRPRVQSQIAEPNPLEFISGDGKSNVVELLDLVLADPASYDQNRFLFFVDKDYDPIQPRPRCYETNVHSLENFYASPSAFRTIVRFAFNMHAEADGRDLNDATSLYEAWSADLCRATLDFHAWLVWQIEEAKDAQGRSPKLNLNSRRLKHLFQLSFTGRTLIIKPVFNIASPAALFPHSVALNQQRFLEIRNELQAIPFLEYFRGKFGLQFLLAALLHIRNDSRQAAPVILTGRRTTLTWSDNVLGEFSPYADTPGGFVRFLRGSFPMAA